MLKKINSLFFKWLYGFLELQLVISLMSLPVLTYWGLPISYMSPISNMIFTPLLILFLWVSCLFSVSAIIGLPCSWLTWALEKTTDLWHHLLSFGSPNYLIGFSFQTWWISVAFCIMVYFLYTYIKPNAKQAVGVLFVFWFLLIISRELMQPKGLCKKIGNKEMTVLHINKKTYLIDYGALCEKQNFYTNIDYSILPSIIKATGITRIDTLVLCKPSASLAKAAYQFAIQTNVKTIIVTTKSNCFKKAKEAFEGTSIEIIPMAKQVKNKTNKPKFQVISECESEFTWKTKKAPAKTRAF